jgi:CBS domain containing-hemolysin-like protein
MGLLLLYLLGAMAISFLCSLLESVLMSTPISYITMKEDEGDRNAVLFAKLKDNPDRPLTAILSLNTIANTVGAAGVGQQATLLFGNQWFGLVSAIMTLLILIFSEIVPKTIGSYHWKDLTWLSRIMKGLMVLLYPLVWIVEKVREPLAGDEPDTTISREEVSAMANIGEEEGVIDNSENKVIQNIIKLDDIKAYDVMTPRVVAAIAPESMTLKQFYKQEDLSHYSRIPVYSDSPEFITGYIMRYDVLENLAEDKFDTRLKSIKRKIAAFHEETSVSDIWESLLKTKDQIALIIDDYGCFQGIITLEDIIETILGMEIIDENDTITDMQQYARERWLKRKNQYKQIVLPDEDPAEA